MCCCDDPTHGDAVPLSRRDQTGRLSAPVPGVSGLSPLRREKEGQLRARLEPGEARLLDDLLGELRLGHATEREAVFHAALALSRELGELA